MAASWRYPGKLSMYDGEPRNWHEFLAVTDAGHGYYAIVEEEQLLGFCCFGPEGRVAGQPADRNGLLDLGGGMRPDLVGQGFGGVGMTAILAYARERFSPAGFRTAVATFNRRSLVLCQRSGFRTTTTFEGPNGQDFTELVLIEAPGVNEA